MAIVTPYNDLQGAKTTGGTWTKVSGPGPSAPLTYNDSIDFTGTSDGITIYEYEVTSSTCTHTALVQYVSTTPLDRINDDCSGASTLYTSTQVLYNDERCPGLVAPTNSGVTLPTTWPSLEPDLWYKFYIPTSTVNLAYEIIVDGSIYSDGIQQPMIAVYDGTCGALNELDSNVGAYKTASVSFTVLSASTPEIIYLRVASTTANAGQFDIIVNEL